MKRPNLFILGAPKCGTTALAKWLSMHPQVFVSPAKEPHYFCEDHRLTPTLAAYEGLFEEADPERHRWVCEASVWHLFSETAVPNILRYAKEARFIVMVRNPLTMAPSMHQQQRFNGNELVPDFAEALALSERRENGEMAGVRSDYTQVRHLAYLRSCALGWQIDRLFRRVARDRVHVVVFDDLEASPERVFAGVKAFLEIPSVETSSFDRVNAAKARRSYLLDAMVLRVAGLKERLGIRQRLGVLSRMRRWNVRGQARPTLPSELQQQMADAFASDVERLSRLIGRDLGHWLDVGGARNG